MVGLIASWWLIPRAHVLELALGAGVALEAEAVARLGGGGFEVPALGFITPLVFLVALVAFRIRNDRPPFPDRTQS